jgi:hypothetical protein
VGDRPARDVLGRWGVLAEIRQYSVSFDGDDIVVSLDALRR